MKQVKNEILAEQDGLKELQEQKVFFNFLNQVARFFFNYLNQVEHELKQAKKEQAKSQKECLKLEKLLKSSQQELDDQVFF